MTIAEPLAIAPRSAPRAGSARPRPQDADRHVGTRIRQRRIALGLTQQELAALVGITYQQMHKYERGLNRIAAGRLHAIARALGVEVGHFFEGLAAGEAAVAAPTPPQRALLSLSRDFAAISNEWHRQAVCDLARVLAAAGPDPVRADAA